MIIFLLCFQNVLNVVVSHKGHVWRNLPWFTKEYSKGVGNFAKNAMVKYAVDDELKCPCSRCKSKHWWGPEDVYNHLIYKGPSLEIADWVYDVSNMNGGSSLVDSEANMEFDDDLEGMLNITYANRGPNADERKFYRLVEDG